MKTRLITAILALILALALAGAGWGGEPTAGLLDKPGPLQIGKQQVACPVQGGKINKDLYVDYQGQRIYFCCPACIPIFKQNPEAYLKKMEREGVLPEKTPSGK
jgi:YHS domain-containing protein